MRVFVPLAVRTLVFFFALSLVLVGTSANADQSCNIMQQYIALHMDGPPPAHDDPDFLALLDQLSQVDNPPNPMPVTWTDVTTFDSNCGDNQCLEHEQGHPCTFHNVYGDWPGRKRTLAALPPQPKRQATSAQLLSESANSPVS